ncbi:hypothetical protein CR513_21820, partial [Mucuna pruriens]
MGAFLLNLEEYEGNLQKGFKTLKITVLDSPMTKGRLRKHIKDGLYLELQSSKLDNLDSLGKLRQRSTASLFRAQLNLTICSVRRPCEVTASQPTLLGFSLYFLAKIVKPWLVGFWAANSSIQSLGIACLYPCEIRPSTVRGRVLIEILEAKKFAINIFLLYMTRSNPSKLHAYDPEKIGHSIDCFINEKGLWLCWLGLYHSDFDFGVCISQFSLDNMAKNDRNLKELATLDVMYQPWCIEYSKLEQVQSYKLNFGQIDLLPNFHGRVGEDPNKNLKEFHVVCSTMRPHGILEDYIKMKTFPFSLDGAAKD